MWSAPRTTISTLDLGQAEGVPLGSNPAHESISALGLADMCMTKNPAYVPIQPHHRDDMTPEQDRPTEPSPSKTWPLPWPPEIETKHKQRQLQYQVAPIAIPLPEQTKTVQGFDDASYVGKAVAMQRPSERVAHCKKVCAVMCYLRQWSKTYTLRS